MFDSLKFVVANEDIGGRGYFSGSPPGIITVETVPAPRAVRVYERTTGRIIGTTFSGPDGTWQIDNLNTNLSFDLVSRDAPIWIEDEVSSEKYLGEVYEDVIVGRARPSTSPAISPLPMTVHIGVPFAKRVPVKYGTGTVTTTITGTLPSGMTTDGDVVKGEWPTGLPGSYLLSVSCEDSIGQTSTKEFFLNLVLLPLVLDVPNVVFIVDEVVNIRFSASGGEGPYGYTISSGSLPSGVTLDEDTGELIGVPEAEGPYTFALTCTDSRSATTSRTYSGKVNGNNSLVLYAPFDGNTKDYATGNNITVMGTGSTYIAGKFDQAISTNLGAAYYQIRRPELILSSDPFTIEFWCQPVNGGSGQSEGRLLQIGPTGTAGSLFITRSSNLNPLRVYVFVVGPGNTRHDIFSGDMIPMIANQVFSHIAVTRDENSVWRLFLNGKKVAEGTFSGVQYNLTSDFLSLGRDTAGAELFNGAYDELRIMRACRYKEDFEPSYTRVITPYTIGFAQGSAVTYQFELSKTVGDVEYAINGTLPPGISFDDDTGELSGTPSATGAYNFSVSLSDDMGLERKTIYGNISAAKQYWRLLFISNNGHNRATVTELQFTGARATGGTALSSGDYDATWAADKAFDGIVTGDQGWASVHDNAVQGAYIGYQFPSAVGVFAVDIFARTNTSGLLGHPRDAFIQSSNDGVRWDDEWAINNQSGWTANQKRTFYRPQVDNVSREEFTYWRLLFTEKTMLNSIFGYSIQVGELEFNGSQALGGTPFASASNENPPQNAIARAFDGVKGDDSFWNAIWDTGISLGYQFSSPRAINSVMITPRTHNDTATRWSPRGFIVQASNDGVNWFDQWIVSGIPAWVPGRTKAFMRTPLHVSQPHKYWRVNITSSNNRAAISLLEFADEIGGPTLTGSGNAIASGSWPNSGGNNYDKENAFNGSTADPAWVSDIVTSGWLGYEFLTPVAIREVRIGGRSASGQCPNTFTIEYSDDGVDWVSVASYANLVSSEWPVDDTKWFTIGV